MTQTAGPPGRTGWTARTRVAMVLIGVTVLSLVVVGVFNYVSARRVLADTVETELVSIGTARAARIVAGLQAVEDTVASLARDGGVVDALVELSAVDGPRSGQAQVEHDLMLRAMAEVNLFADLILVDGRSTSVVYSVDERLDVATDLAAGDYAGTAVSEAVLGTLGSAVPADATVVDFEAYAPSGGAPVMFVVSPIRSEGRVAGALVAEITIDVLDSITTADLDWDGTGLGETGEIYLVGPDHLMRSDSRRWLENPASYRQAVLDAGHPEEIADAVESFGTTALTQPVDSQPVETALAGDRFVGRAVNYLGQDTLTVAAPLDAGNLGWVMVAEMTTAEAEGSIQDYRRRALLLAAILVPLVAVIGLLLSRRLLRPIPGITAAARAVGAGELDVTLPEESRDEFGELGKRFNVMVAARQQQEARLAQVDDEVTELLASVLPAHMVEQVKRGDTGVAEALRNATLIALLVDEPDKESPVDEELLRDVRVELSTDLAALAGRLDVQPLHTSASQLLFAAGLRIDGIEATDAVEFATAALTAAARRGEQHGVALSIHAGLAAGDVVAGVVGTERLAFDVWGEPLRIAKVLAAAAGPGEVVVDGSVAAAVEGNWVVGQMPDLVDDGEPLPGWRIGTRR
jgi:HAMP domain-containing protein